MQEEKESVWVNSIYPDDDFSFNQRDGLFEETKKANEESERKDGKNEGEKQEEEMRGRAHERRTIKQVEKRS